MLASKLIKQQGSNFEFNYASTPSQIHFDDPLSCSRCSLSLEFAPFARSFDAASLPQDNMTALLRGYKFNLEAQMNNFGLGKEGEKDQRRQSDAMLAELNRRRLLQAVLGPSPSPSPMSAQSSDMNQRLMRETELTLARLNAERALVQSLYANRAGHNLNIGPAAATSLPHHLPAAPHHLHEQQNPSLPPLSLFGLHARSRIGSGALRPSISPNHGPLVGQRGVQNPVFVSAIGHESEGSVSATSQQDSKRPYEGREFQVAQARKQGPRVSEKEKKETFPLPAKRSTSDNQPDYTPPKILSLSGFEQKWKILERQLQKKRAAGKISEAAVGEIQREFFLRSIQKGDTSHLYRRIHGIKTRSDAYGRLSKRPRLARKEG